MELQLGLGLGRTRQNDKSHRRGERTASGLETTGQ
jgi:hypothetical protein